jgi:calcium-dependent protein kinase
MEYVMKIQYKKRLRAETEDLFRRGLEGLMNMPDNSHIVQIHSCLEDSHYFYTIMEPCDGGDLSDFFDVLRAPDVDDQTREDEVRQIMYELLTSLDHIHKQGLLHKDIKLENFVFKNKASLRPRVPTLPGERQAPGSSSSQNAAGVSKRPSQLKLIDFDSTEQYKRMKSKIVLGTDGYIAPEGYLGYISPKSDIFSAGVIMYLLMSNRFPYDDELFDDAPGENYVGSPTMQGVYDNLRKTKVHFGTPWKEREQAKSFCKALLEFNVSRRLTAEEALKHPYMRQNDPFWM